jgi:Putative zinc-finger
MSCLSIEELYAYLDGDLPPAAKRRVEAHAIACAECRAVIEDRRAFLEAASSLPLFDVPASFASSIAARLETVPAPERKRLPIWTWIAASAAGGAAFLATLTGIALVTGQNLWQYLARLQHGSLDYLKGAVTAVIRLLKYTQIFVKVAGDFGSALMDTARRAMSIIPPQIQAACAVSTVLILAMFVVLWRHRGLSMENHHDE